MSDKGPSIQDEPQVNLYAIFVGVICSLTWGASMISRAVWSSTIANESAIQGLGITLLQAGGIGSAFFVGYSASNAFSGFIIDRIGAKWSLAITALGTGAATVLICFTTGYWAMFALRVVAGIFAGPLFSSIVKFNFAYFPNRLRAVVTGALGAGPALGNAIAAAFFTPLVKSKGHVVAFAYAGISTIIIGILCVLILKDRGLTLPVKDMTGISDEEKANVTKNSIKLFTHPQFLIGTLGHFLIMCAGTGMTTWILKYLIDVKGMSAATAGLVFGSSTLVGMVSGTLAGIINDALKTRRTTMIIGAIIYGAMFNLYRVFDSVSALTAVAIALQLVTGLVGSSSNVMQQERAKGPYSGQVMGYYNACCQLGSVVMPLILGGLFDSTGSVSVIVTAISAVYFMIAVVAFFLKDTYGKPPLLEQEANR
ncbi:MAG: MFS transporter [Eubacteriaceae bacterium]|nr:MFS transporter [Eubacteriaceae bacterium]